MRQADWKCRLAVTTHTFKRISALLHCRPSETGIASRSGGWRMNSQSKQHIYLWGGVQPEGSLKRRMSGPPKEYRVINRNRTLRQFGWCSPSFRCSVSLVAAKVLPAKRRKKMRRPRCCSRPTTSSRSAPMRWRPDRPSPVPSNPSGARTCAQKCPPWFWRCSRKTATR